MGANSWPIVSLIGTDKSIASFESPTFNNPTSYTDMSLSFLVTVTDNDGATSNKPVTVIITQLNLNPPTANAGTTTHAQVGDLVKLDGNGSSDIESASLSYSWIQTDDNGVSITLSDSETSSPSFIMPDTAIEDALVFQLTVTDLGGKERNRLSQHNSRSPKAYNQGKN